VKLDNLQQKLQIYKDSNRNIILEESEGAMDTSQRIRNINYDSSRMSAGNRRDKEAEEGQVNGTGGGKTIIYERLSTVSSQSKQ
jgi:hypothetical protein